MKTCTETALCLAITVTLAAIGLRFSPFEGLEMPVDFGAMTSARAEDAAERFFAERLNESHPDMKHDLHSVEIIRHINRKESAYVELEYGGTQALRQLVERANTDPLLYAFHWKVRLLSELQEKELAVYLSPAGNVSGFELKIPRNETPRVTVDDDTALGLAEACIAQTLGQAALDSYVLEGHSTTHQPSGRTDHTFIHQHNETVGDMKFMVHTTIAGNRCIAVAPVVSTPKGFEMRYAAMRSRSNEISSAAWVVCTVLLLAACVALVFAWRRDTDSARSELSWRISLILSLVVAALAALATLDAYGDAWGSYAPIEPVSEWRAVFFTTCFFSASGTFVNMFIICMVGRYITKSAFPGDVDIQDIFVARKAAALDGTLVRKCWLSYIFAAGMLCEAVLVYSIVSWYSPDKLPDFSNLHASMPVLGALATSLLAGITEEYLFRGIVLGLFALLGSKLRCRTACLALGMVFQALLFGAAHTSYPTLPSYVRIVEIFSSSLMFGAVFLTNGLVTSMLAHALYDLLVLVLPVFTNTFGNYWAHRIFAAFLLVTPLLFAFYRKYRTLSPVEKDAIVASVAATTVSAERTATQGTPPVPTEELPEAAKVLPENSALIHSRPFKAALVLLLAVAVMAIAHRQGTCAADRFSDSYEAVRAQAKNTLNTWAPDALARGEWIELVFVDKSDVSMSEFAFMSEEVDSATIHDVMSRFMSPSRAAVQFRRTDGPQSERTECYTVYVRPDRSAGLRHKIPDDRVGANLTRDTAFDIVMQWKASRRGAAELATDLVSEKQIVRLARKDWLFTFEVPNRTVSPKYHAPLQFSVLVSGERVVSEYWDINVPQEWPGPSMTKSR